MKSLKLILFLILTQLLSNAVAQNLFIKFDGDLKKINASSYTDFLNGERKALELVKLGLNLYQVKVSVNKKSAVIFSYEGKFSHPYYLDETALDTITLSVGPKIIYISNAKSENIHIQYFEAYLNDLFQQKIKAKSKIKMGQNILDSLEKVAKTDFEKSSLYFQFYMFSYVLNKQMKVSDKKMILWSRSMKLWHIDSEIGAMMAFFLVTNTPLWYCAQHTQGNIPFLRIKTKENLHKVIFAHKIFLHKEYVDMSNYLKIKHISKTKAYLGPTDDLIEIIDSLNTLSENYYLKNCYARLKNGINQKVEKSSIGVLNGYPFTDKNGKEIYVDSLLGKYILIDFWATWCRPCIAGFEKLKKIHDVYKDSLVILSINVDDSHSKMVNFLNKRADLTWDFFYTGLNESVLSRFDVLAYPHYAILDKDGSVIFKQIDGLNSKELIDFLTKIKY